MKKLTTAQEKALLYKYLTGNFPAMANGGKTLDALFAAGMLEEEFPRVLVTKKGRDYCDEHHMRIFTEVMA